MRFQKNQISLWFSCWQEGRNENAARVVYEHIKGAILPTSIDAANRYTGVISTLRVLGQCAPDFRHFFTPEAMKILDNLNPICIQHHNKQVRSAADEALSAVFAQVGASLIQTPMYTILMIVSSSHHAEQSPSTTSHINVVLMQIARELASAEQGSTSFDLMQLTSTLIARLRNMLLKQSSDHREVRVAIKGIGYMARPCMRFFGQEVGLLNTIKVYAELYALMNGHDNQTTTESTLAAQYVHVQI